jgi:tRNA A-37 threonylcarbamoyl transferase component Bud32
MFDSLNLKDLVTLRKAVLRPPSPTRPRLWLIEQDGVRAVVKDFSSTGFWFRNLAGRFLVWRESRALKKLENLAGVPRLYRVMDGLALVLEEIPGTSLTDLKGKRVLPEDFFAACQRLVSHFHARGIAHCDLKRAPNIILGSDGRPHIVDWAAAIKESEFSFFPLNRIYRRFLLDDELAIIKLKLKHCPHAVTEEEKKCFEFRSGTEKSIRAIRDRLRRLLKRVA